MLFRTEGQVVGCGLWGRSRCSAGLRGAVSIAHAGSVFELGAI